MNRFDAKYEPEPMSGCFLWTGALDQRGYGRFNHDYTYTRAHRYAFEHERGPIPDGLVIDHLCRNRACVNPAHMRVVTNTENVLAPGSLSLPRLQKEKTHCKHGHPFSGDNLRMKRHVNGRQTRVCRACTQARDRKRYWIKREALNAD